jgi:hypothetical protein
LFHGCQQFSVKIAEIIAEGVPLDWVRADLQGVALQGQGDNAPTLLRVDEFALLILIVVCFLDEVQAVLNEAQRTGLLPLARNRAAMLPSEREDLQPVILLVADEQLLAMGELSSLLTMKTLTGMTTDVYPRENCL